MKAWKVLCAVAVLGIPVVAFAQEAGPAPAPKKDDAPAAAKHENKVSDAARAAMEKAEKLRYSPIKAGLKEMAGTMKTSMEMAAGGGGGGRGMRGMGGMGDREFAVSFKAPEDLKVEAKKDPSGSGDAAGSEGMARMMEGMRRRMAEPVKSLLRNTLLGVQQEGEYDADVRVDAGATVLVVTHYENNVETGTTELVLGENGLPVSGTTTPKAAEGGDPAGGPGRGGRGRGRGGMGGQGKMTMKFTWGKAGDLYRLEKVQYETPMGSMESALRWVDAGGGVQVLGSWETTLPGGMGNSGYRFTDLTVNGKAVTLPAETPKSDAGKDGAKGKHEGKGEDDEDGEDEGNEGGEGGMGGK